MIILNHENVVPISSILYVDDDPKKEIGYTMNLFWLGDLIDMINEL